MNWNCPLSLLSSDLKYSPRLKVQLQRNLLSKGAAGSRHSLLLFFPSSLPAHLLPFLSSSFNASHSVNLPCSECLETMHQSLHKECGLRLLSSCSPVGLAAAPCSGLPRQQPDPRTSVQLPGAKSSNDRLPPLRQSQRHTGSERPDGKKSNFCILEKWAEGYLSICHPQ